MEMENDNKKKNASRSRISSFVRNREKLRCKIVPRDAS